MKSAVENLSPTRVKLTVEVPFEELKPSIDAAYKTIAQQVQVPGFRRGKVPARIIDQRVGKGAVLQEAVNEALPELYSTALAESGVFPLGQPEVDVTEVPLDETQQLAFTAELDVRPVIELPDFSAITVEVDPVEVSDEDVEANIKQLQDRFGTLVGVERAAQDGDFVSIDLTATIGEETIDSVAGISYQIGAGNMLEGMDAALVGMNADEEKTFSAPLAGGEHAGEDADITVKLLSVKERQLPELDDEFAQLASQFDTFEELRADVASQTERAKKFEQGAQARDKVLEHLLETLEIPVPDSIVAAEVENHFASGHEQTDDLDAHREEFTKNTTAAIRTQFLLDTIAERDEVEVGQDELIEYLVMSAQQYGMDPNQFAQIMDQQGQVPAMVSEVARRKALANVLEQIGIKDTTGAVVNLSDLDIVEEVDDEDESQAPTDAPAPAVEEPAEDKTGDTAETAAEDKPAKAAKKTPAKKTAAVADETADEPAKKTAKKAPAKKATATADEAGQAPADEAADQTGETEADKPARKTAKKAPAKKAPAKKAAKADDQA